MNLPRPTGTGASATIPRAPAFLSNPIRYDRCQYKQPFVLSLIFCEIACFACFRFCVVFLAPPPLCRQVTEHYRSATTSTPHPTYYLPPCLTIRCDRCQYKQRIVLSMRCVNIYIYISYMYAAVRREKCLVSHSARICVGGRNHTLNLVV